MTPYQIPVILFIWVTQIHSWSKLIDCALSHDFICVIFYSFSFEDQGILCCSFLAFMQFILICTRITICFWLVPWSFLPLKLCSRLKLIPAKFSLVFHSPWSFEGHFLQVFHTHSDLLVFLLDYAVMKYGWLWLNDSRYAFWVFLHRFRFCGLIFAMVLMSFGGIKLVVGFCTLRYAQLPNSNYLVQVCFLRF